MSEQTPPGFPKGESPAPQAPVTPPNHPAQIWAPSPDKAISQNSDTQSETDPFIDSPREGDGEAPTTVTQKSKDAKEKAPEAPGAKEKPLMQEIEAKDASLAAAATGKFPGLAPSGTPSQRGRSTTVAETGSPFPLKNHPTAQAERERASSASAPKPLVPGEGERRATSAKDKSSKRPSSRASSRQASSAPSGKSNVRQRTDSVSSAKSGKAASQSSSLKSAPSPKGKGVERTPSTLERRLSQSRALRKRINSLSIQKDGDNVIFGPPRPKSTSPDRSNPPSRTSSFLAKVNPQNWMPQKIASSPEHEDSGGSTGSKKETSKLRESSLASNTSESHEPEDSQQDQEMEGNDGKSPPPRSWRRTLRKQNKGEPGELSVDIPALTSPSPAGQKSAKIPLTPHTPRATAGEFLAEVQARVKRAIEYMKKDLNDKDNKFTFQRFLDALSLTTSQDYADSEGEPFGDNEAITVEALDRVILELTAGTVQLDQDVRQQNWELQRKLEEADEDMYNTILSNNAKNEQIRDLEHEISRLESNNNKLNTQVRKLNKSLLDTQNILRQQPPNSGSVEESALLEQLQKDYERASTELELSEEARARLQEDIDELQFELQHWAETAKVLDAIPSAKPAPAPAPAPSPIGLDLTAAQHKILDDLQAEAAKLEKENARLRSVLAKGGNVESGPQGVPQGTSSPGGLNLTKAQDAELLAIGVELQKSEEKFAQVQAELVEARDLQETLKGQLKDAQQEIQGLEAALRTGKSSSGPSGANPPDSNPAASEPSQGGGETPTKPSPHGKDEGKDKGKGVSRGNLDDEIREVGRQGPPTDPSETPVYHEPCQNCIPIYLYYPDSYLFPHRRFQPGNHARTLPELSQTEPSPSSRSKVSLPSQGSGSRKICCEHFDEKTKHCDCEGRCPAHPCCEHWVNGKGCGCEGKCHNCCAHYAEGDCGCNETCDSHPCCEHYNPSFCHCEGDENHYEERVCPTWKAVCGCGYSCQGHGVCEHWIPEAGVYACQEPCARRKDTGKCDHPVLEESGEASCVRVCDKNPCCRHCHPSTWPPKCKCGGRCRLHRCCGHWDRDTGICSCEPKCEAHKAERFTPQEKGSIRGPLSRYTRSSPSFPLSSLGGSRGGGPSWTRNSGPPPIIGYVCLDHQGWPRPATSRRENLFSQNLGLLGRLFGAVFEDPPHDIWQLLLCMLFFPIYLLYNFANIFARTPWRPLPKFLPKGTVVTVTRVLSLVYLACLFISVKEERRIWLRANGATAAYLRDIRSRSPYPWWSPVEADLRFIEPWLGEITETVHRYFFPRRTLY